MNSLEGVSSDPFDSNMEHFYFDPNEVLNKNLHFGWQPLLTCKPEVLVIHLWHSLHQYQVSFFDDKFLKEGMNHFH